MTLTFPSWWRGFRWDSERLLKDLFTFEDNPAAAHLSGLQVVPWFPPIDKREEWLAADNAYLWIHRLGGQLRRQDMTGTDEAIIQLAGLTKSRERTIELMDYVSMVLCMFDEGGYVERKVPHLSGTSTTFMKVPGEIVGPQLIPERFRDERLIPAQWSVHADLPQGLPDYRGHLGLD